MSITPLAVTFDGVDIAARLSSLGASFRVLSVEGAGLHGAEVVTERQPGYDGSRLVDSYLPERVVTVGFTLRSAVEVGSAAAESQSDAERELNGIMAGQGLAPLELSHIVGWHFMAKAGGVRVSSRAAHYMEGELSFVCPSPFLREVTPHRVSAGYDSTFTLDRGNATAFPSFEFKMGNEVGTVTLTINQVTVNIDTSGISAGHVVFLDWDRMRFSELDSSGARVSSIVSRMDTFERPRLPVGETVPIQFSPASQVDAETLIPNARRV